MTPDELKRWLEVMLPSHFTAYADRYVDALLDPHGHARMLFDLGRQWEREGRPTPSDDTESGT